MFAEHVTSWPGVSHDTRIQNRYVELRMNGQSHNMAEVLATRSFPGTRTDREFQLGRCNGNQFEDTPARGNWYRQAAESRGVSTTGKFYHDGLAQYPGDPLAWVSDRSDVLRVARERGLRLSGMVDYEPPDFRGHAPSPDLPIDPGIVAAEVDDIMDSDPGLRRGDVEEKVYALRTGAIDPNPLLVKDCNSDDTPDGF